MSGSAKICTLRRVEVNGPGEHITTSHSIKHWRARTGLPRAAIQNADFQRRIKVTADLFQWSLHREMHQERHARR